MIFDVFYDVIYDVFYDDYDVCDVKQHTDSVIFI